MVGVEKIVCWSGGKDSTAVIIKSKELGLDIDYILFSEVMFNEKISCEYPAHMDFIKNVAIPTFRQWGYRVEILRHDKTYMDYFNQVRMRGNNIGKCVGFPMADKCNLRNCKIAPIESFLKEHPNAIQYVGITADEPRRLARLPHNKVSLLAEHGFTQEMARKLCEDYGLLSPMYQFFHRTGCWLCPNASLAQLRFLRRHHPELWGILLDLEKRDNLVGNIFNTQAQRSIVSLEEQFFWEDRQLSIFDSDNLEKE